MKIDVLLRAAQILRSQPAHTMSLHALHASLARELRADETTYAELYHELKKRPDSFAIFDSPQLLPASASWPRYVREQYEGALADVGMGSCLRIALTDVPDTSSDDPIARAASTVSAFWPAAEKDPTLRDVLQRASDQLAEISASLQPAPAAGRPTTHPRDLRREP